MSATTIIWTVWKWAKKPGRGKNVPKHAAFSWQRAGSSQDEAKARKKAQSLSGFHNYITVTAGVRPSWTPGDQPVQKIDGVCVPLSKRL